MFDDLSIGKIFLILLVILIFFGPKRIPDIAQSLGKGIREFKKAMRDITDEVQKSAAEEPKAQSVPPKMIESSTQQSAKVDPKSETELKS
ncbi:MAG: twin-arginine translocase TatA/TatE family subunit [Bacteroidetes bacterium]|nr:twin-arginine translocase TatA/TatE family subunit [Bacteroidota bacterium]